MAVASATLETIYRNESRRVFASLVRLLGDLDLAEEATQEAFAAAVEAWNETGVPEQPRAWLVSTGRFRGIDALRRRGRLDGLRADISARLSEVARVNATRADAEIEDDRLRLIFTCCHPALDPAIQVPLTLREVCGLTTEEIARAFLVAPTTMAQRIVRGKAKIRDARIPVIIPTAEELPDRLDSVLTVIYLVFTEGYSASAGESAVRADLSAEAIRLGRLVNELLPHPEVIGLVALMLLQESRRHARVTPEGDLVLLEDQDRTRWDRTMIEEGQRLVTSALSQPNWGAYAVQAAIAAVHAGAASAEQTDWAQIVSLYDTLRQLLPSPVIDLNRAVALAMRDGPTAGLAEIDTILARGELSGYHRIHAARAEFLRRLGRVAEARLAYELALAQVRQEPERRFLQRRYEELG